MDLPLTYVSMLETIYKAGGEALLDRDYKVVVGPTKKPIPGNASQFLWLVSRGLLIGGSQGKLFLTDDANAVIEGVRKQRGQV